MSTKQAMRNQAPRGNRPAPASTPKQKEEAAKEPKAPKPDKMCQCYTEPVPGSEGVFRSCGRITKGTYAPGHDAKLKGLLIKATVDGVKYVVLGDDGKTTSRDPELLAADLGWAKYTERALEIKAEKAAAAERKAAEKAAAAPTKVKPTKQAAADEEGIVSIKIGRFVHKGKIVGKTGDTLHVEYLKGGKIVKADVPFDSVVK